MTDTESLLEIYERRLPILEDRLGHSPKSEKHARDLREAKIIAQALREKVERERNPQ